MFKSQVNLLFKNNSIISHRIFKYNFFQNKQNLKLFSTQKNTSETTKSSFLQHPPLAFAATAFTSTALLCSPSLIASPPHVAAFITACSSMVTVPCAYFVSRKVWTYWQDENDFSWKNSFKLASAVVIPSSFLVSTLLVIYSYTSASYTSNSTTEKIQVLIFGITATYFLSSLSFPLTIPITAIASRWILKNRGSLILLKKFEGIIDKAKNQNSIVWVDYANKGLQSNRRERPLRIVGWEKQPLTFRANCMCKEIGCDSSVEKRYNLKHIVKIIENKTQ